MSPRQLVACAALAIIALALLGGQCRAQTGRDTTIYTATRVITSATGKIASVSVTKVAAPAGGRVDTLIWQSNLNAAKDSLVFTGPFRYSPINGPAVPPGFPLPPGPVRVVPGPAVHDTLPMVWSPNTNATRDSVLWVGPYAWPTNSRPTNFKLPPGPATVVHDTVFVAVPAPPVPPPSSGVFVFDPPARAGENNVFQGTAYLGRVMVDNVGQWFAYRYTAGQSLMPQSGPYPSKAAAMAALAP